MHGPLKVKEVKDVFGYSVSTCEDMKHASDMTDATSIVSTVVFITLWILVANFMGFFFISLFGVTFNVFY
jgi:hypothetical protein